MFEQFRGGLKPHSFSLLGYTFELRVSGCFANEWWLEKRVLKTLSFQSEWTFDVVLNTLKQYPAKRAERIGFFLPLIFRAHVVFQTLKNSTNVMTRCENSIKKKSVEPVEDRHVMAKIGHGSYKNVINLATSWIVFNCGFYFLVFFPFETVITVIIVLPASTQNPYG